MTKSFFLSVLVPALSVAAAFVPLAVWTGFSTPGWQVSPLPALFPAFLTAAIWHRFSKSTNRAALATCAVVAGSWHALLWGIALTQPPEDGVLTALAKALSAALYVAPPFVLVGLAGTVASLGLMMSVPPVRGSRD